MKQFLRFYAWGVEVKLYMSIYTAAVVFFQGITEVLQGRYTISVWVVCANVLYIGGALVFGWFPGVPQWLRPPRRRSGLRCTLSHPPSLPRRLPL